jgi:hypothetical protein
MYQVSWFFNKVDNGYESVMVSTHELYLLALTDAIIEWFINRKVKCVTIEDRNTGKVKLSWKRN